MDSRALLRHDGSIPSAIARADHRIARLQTSAARGFEAPDAETVRHIARRMGYPYERIWTATRLSVTDQPA